jgi:hypothetical protein
VAVYLSACLASALGFVTYVASVVAICMALASDRRYVLRHMPHCVVIIMPECILRLSLVGEVWYMYMFASTIRRISSDAICHVWPRAETAIAAHRDGVSALC